MGIQYFEEWAVENRLVHEDGLAALGRPEQGPLVGIDAAHFLERFRHPSKEPLVPALGGFPMALEALIAKQVTEIQSFGCRLWFYFDGLESPFESVSVTSSINTMRTVSEAFGIYEKGEATKAIERFRQSDYPDMATLTAFAKVALHKHGIPFSVAPFKAHAQMVSHLEEGILDALYGSTELFLFGAEKVITKMNLVHQTREQEEMNGAVKKEPEFLAEKSTFSWIEREPCLKALGDISPDAFVDALLAAGSSYLGTFPPLLNQQPFSFRQLVDMLGSYQHDIRRLCSMYPHDEHLAQSQWEDRYMRVHTAIQHMPVLFGSDKVEPRSHSNPARFGRIPQDLHMIVGIQLPEELLNYLYHGMIGPRVLNGLISGKIRVPAPLAGGDAPAFRKLVKEQLRPWRQQALALLAYAINRWFQSREIETLYWSGDPDKFNMKDQSSQQQQISSWRVKKEALEAAKRKISLSESHGPGTLQFVVRAIVDSGFAAETVSQKPRAYEPLTDADEIVTNAIYRGLHLRGFVDDKHQLTTWGKVLATTMEKLGNDSTREQAEAAFVSIELLRLGLLSADDMFPSPLDTSAKGSETDERDATLLSRVAATGRMRHPVRGYSGPLSRQILSYHSLITEVRNALRDLFEMALAVMFLEAGVQRIRDDYAEIAKILPFQENYSAGLGVIAKTYFDELARSETPTDKATQQGIVEQAEGWFFHIDVSNSLKDACQLWKAVCAGIKEAGSVVDESQKKDWAATEKWMLERVGGAT